MLNIVFENLTSFRESLGRNLSSVRASRCGDSCYARPLPVRAELFPSWSLRLAPVPCEGREAPSQVSSEDVVLRGLKVHDRGQGGVPNLLSEPRGESTVVGGAQNPVR